MKKCIVLLMLAFLNLGVFSQELRFANNCNICFRAIDNRINIRTEPNTNSKILGQLNEYEIIYVNKEKSTTNWLFCYIPKINNVAYVYAEYFKETPDYNNGNGTIIFEDKNNNQIIIRKHNQVINNIYLQYLYSSNSIPIMSSYNSDAKELGSIKEGDDIKVTKVMTRKVSWKNEIWLEIEFQKIIGWIFISNDTFWNPYSTYDYNCILYYKEINQRYIPVYNVQLGGTLYGNANLYVEPDNRSDVVTQAHMTLDKNKSEVGETNYSNASPVWLNGKELIYVNGKAWIYTKFENSYGWIEYGKLDELGGNHNYPPENKIQFFFDPPA